LPVSQGGGAIGVDRLYRDMSDAGILGHQPLAGDENGPGPRPRPAPKRLARS